MPFEKGSFALTLFHLPDKLPKNALDAFSGKAAGKLDDLRDEMSIGWVSGRHLLERKIDDETAYCGGFLYLNLRSAQRKIPSALLKAECRMSELEYMRENKSLFAPSKVRRDIRKDIEERRLMTMPPQLSGTPFIIDHNSGILYLGSSSPKKIDSFLTFFYETFKLELRQINPEDIMFRLFKQTLDKLNAVRFAKDSKEESNPGRDFLTWLWFYSEQKGGKLKTQDFGTFEIMIDGPLTFSYSDDEVTGAAESVVRKGNPLRSAEAKAALEVGKKLKKAKFSLVRDNEVWKGTFIADQFAFSGLCLPEGEKMDDINSIFAERVNYLHIFQTVLQEYFKLFVSTVNGDKSKKEENEILSWASERESC